MAQSDSKWLQNLCDEIIFMLDNNQFNFTNSIHYNKLIVKIFKDYLQYINSYNKQEANPDRFFDNYTQEEALTFNIFKNLLKESNQLINIHLKNQADVALLEKYFNEISLSLNNTLANPTYLTHFQITSFSTYTNGNDKKIIKANEKKLDNFTLIAQQQKEIEWGQIFLYQNSMNIANRILGNYYRTVNFLENQGLKIWKDENNRLYYSKKAFEKEQKASKHEIADILQNSILGFYANIYDSTSDVQVVDANYVIISLLITVRKDIFNPFSSSEFVWICNNLYYRNKFEYTELLKKRFYIAHRPQLQQEINNLKQQSFCNSSYDLQNLLLNQIQAKEKELNFINESLITQENSFIEQFLKLIFQNENEFNYFILWLSKFFCTLNKSNIAVVLIGDNETTDILVDYIIKPIFARNKKYISTITNDSLSKESDNNKLLIDKIFYHLNNLSGKIDTKRVSKLLRNIVKPNYTLPNQAWDNDEPYIYGELLVTSEKDNPYSYLKDIFSSCTVLRIKSMDTILNKLDMDYSKFELSITNDLNNFTNKLMHHSQNNYFPTVLNTDEKLYLHTMKSGVLVTPTIDKKIYIFIEDILSKNVSAFKLIQDDEEMYDELLSNFNEEMITQPLLSTYFNIINSDMLIPDNNEFIKILQTKADMYKEIPTDKSKAYGKKRYKIFR